ncbi:hypothetical protein CVT26_012364, partial [Gymnopilus dilepis]
MPTVRNNAQHTAGSVPRASRGTAYPPGGPSRQRSRKRNKPRKHRDRNPFVDDEAQDGHSDQEEVQIVDEGGVVDEGEWKGVEESEQDAQESGEGEGEVGQESGQGVEDAVGTPQVVTATPVVTLNDTSDDELGQWDLFEGRVIATLPARATKTQVAAPPKKSRKTAQQRAQEDAAMRSPPHKRLKPAERALIQSGYTVAPPARPSRTAEPKPTQASTSAAAPRRRREEDTAPPVIYYKQSLPQSHSVVPPGPYIHNEREHGGSVRLSSKSQPTIDDPASPLLNEADGDYRNVEPVPVLTRTASRSTRIQTAPSPPPRTPRYRSPSLEYVDAQPQSRPRSPSIEVPNVDKGKRRTEQPSNEGRRGRSMTRRPVSTPTPSLRDADDIHMQSPQYIPAEGSSRSSGGVLRGNAFGNHPNMADFEDDGYYSDERSISQGYRDPKIQPYRPQNLQESKRLPGHHHEDPNDEAGVVHRQRRQELEDGRQDPADKSGRPQRVRRQDIQNQTLDQQIVPQVLRRQERESQPAVAGVIFMYNSDKAPGEVDADFEKPIQIKIPDISRYQTYKHVIRRTLRDWSPPRYSDNGYRIYYMDNTWTLLGNYSDIVERNVEDDDEVYWAPLDKASDKRYVQILCSNYQPSGVTFGHYPALRPSHPLSLASRSTSLDT